MFINLTSGRDCLGSLQEAALVHLHLLQYLVDAPGLIGRCW